MPDICMCMDVECPSRVTCGRYLSVPNPYRQSYLTKPREGNEDKCEHYWSECPYPRVGLAEADEKCRRMIQQIIEPPSQD